MAEIKVKLYGKIHDSFISALHHKAYKVVKEHGEDYNIVVFSDTEGLTTQALRDEVLRGGDVIILFPSKHAVDIINTEFANVAEESKGSYLLKGRGEAVADGGSDLKKVIAYMRFFAIFPDRLRHSKLEEIPKEEQLSSGLGDGKKEEKEIPEEEHFKAIVDSVVPLGSARHDGFTGMLPPPEADGLWKHWSYPRSVDTASRLSGTVTCNIWAYLTSSNSFVVAGLVAGDIKNLNPRSGSFNVELQIPAGNHVTSSPQHARTDLYPIEVGISHSLHFLPASGREFPWSFSYSNSLTGLTAGWRTVAESLYVGFYHDKEEWTGAIYDTAFLITDVPVSGAYLQEALSGEGGWTTTWIELGSMWSDPIDW